MYFDYYLYYFSYLSSLYQGYPMIVRMTIVMVTVLALVSLVGFIQLLFVGYKVRRDERRRRETKEYFEDRLLFVMNTTTVYELNEVKQLLKYDSKSAKYWKADVLTDLVLDVKESLRQQGLLNEYNYRNCLEALRIMGFWEKRVRKSGLNKRREALQVIGQFDNGVNVSTLSKSTFHKNKQLRKTARELYTEYDNYNPFRFMEDNFDESFTSLDKLRLHATLVKRDKEVKLPNLLRWINNSKNVDYINFLIKEIAFFRQHEAAPTLIMMLDKQENKGIRVQIIETLGELGGTEYVSFLIERFSLDSALVRDAIIKALGKLKGNESLKFLIDTYEKTEDSAVKLLLARSIMCHGEEGELALKTLKLNVKSQQKEGKLLEQVISERIISPA